MARRVDEIRRHKLTANPLFEAADAQNLLPSDSMPSLAPATPCLSPEAIRYVIGIFPDRFRADTAVAAVCLAERPDLLPLHRF
jgi:hypothetical protein